VSEQLNKLREALELDAKAKAVDLKSVGLIQAYVEGGATDRERVLMLAEALEKYRGESVWNEEAGWDMFYANEALAKLYAQIGVTK